MPVSACFHFRRGGGSSCSIRSLMKCIDLWNPGGNQDTKSSCHSKETSSCCPFLVTPAPKLQSLAITAQFSIGTFCNKLPECFIKWNHAVFQDWLFFFFLVSILPLKSSPIFVYISNLFLLLLSHIRWHKYTAIAKRIFS